MPLRCEESDDDSGIKKTLAVALPVPRYLRPRQPARDLPRPQEFPYAPPRGSLMDAAP